MADLLQFPRSPENGATRINKALTMLRLTIGRILARFGFPGAVGDADILDELTGQNIRIRVGPLFTCIKANGRDFYFCRFPGRFDGSGSGCS